MQETWAQFLGQEDPLEKEMATHSNILVRRIPRTMEPGGLQCIGWQKVRLTTHTHPHTHIYTQTHTHTYIICAFMSIYKSDFYYYIHVIYVIYT